MSLMYAGMEVEEVRRLVESAKSHNLIRQRQESEISIDSRVTRQAVTVRAKQRTVKVGQEFKTFLAEFAAQIPASGFRKEQLYNFNADRGFQFRRKSLEMYWGAARSTGLIFRCGFALYQVQPE